MTASVGIWLVGDVEGGLLYRWRADAGNGGSGFVHFDPSARRIRPADPHGRLLGDLVVDARSGETTGEAVVDRLAFITVAGAILRAFARDGRPPPTAHASFY